MTKSSGQQIQLVHIEEERLQPSHRTGSRRALSEEYWGGPLKRGRSASSNSPDPATWTGALFWDDPGTT